MSNPFYGVPQLISKGGIIILKFTMPITRKLRELWPAPLCLSVEDLVAGVASALVVVTDLGQGVTQVVGLDANFLV